MEEERMKTGTGLERNGNGSTRSQEVDGNCEVL